MPNLPRMDSLAARTSGWPVTLLLFVLVFLIDCLAVTKAAAGISLYDQLATPAHPFFLKLRTHRGPLALGGVRGSFWIDDQKVGIVLTGADGYGFLKYTAPSTGTHVLSARTAAGDAQARLHIVAPTTAVVLIEAEALLWQMQVLNRKLSADDAMARIAADFELAYLCAPTGQPAIKPLLSSRGLPDALVLAGEDRNQFKRLANRGVRIYAVVGSARFVDSAQGYGQHYFSFEKSDKARHVKHWEDLIDQLQSEEKSP